MPSTLILAADRDLVRRVCSCCGSLAATPDVWHALFASLEARNADASAEAGFALLRDAVPEEGEIHPRRGDLQVAEPGCVSFATPGGVTVTIAAGGQYRVPPLYAGYGSDGRPVIMAGFGLVVDFGRDSRALAWLMAGAISGDAVWLDVAADGVEMTAGELLAVLSLRLAGRGDLADRLEGEIASCPGATP